MTRIDRIVAWIQDYFIANGPDCKAVIGISGGKDSTVTAALLVQALGPDNVVAVKMPQGVQYDIDIANEVIEYLGITQSYEINIDTVCEALYYAIDCGYDYDHKIEQTVPAVRTNTPARIRMTVLYAIAAAVHGRVVNTCNRSENYVGYSTKFGDAAGDFSILSRYTVREILEIGYELGLPKHFIHKVPEDGLSGKTDEDNLGFTYDTLDDYLLENIRPDYETFKNIQARYARNSHKERKMPMCPRYKDPKEKEQILESTWEENDCI